MAQTTVTEDSAVEHFLDALRDPLQPKFCVQYYLYFANVIRMDVTDDTPEIPIKSNDPASKPLLELGLSRIRARHPEVLRSLLDFLRVERSREEMRSLALSTEVCSCDRQKDALVDQFHDWEWLDHESAPGKFPGVFHPRTMSLQSLILAISDLLATPVEESVMNWEAGRPVSGWPLSLTNITGPRSDTKRMVTMLCRWLDEYTSLQVVELIGSFADGELIVSTLLHSATLPKSIVTLLNRILESMPSNMPLHGLGMLMGSSRPMVIILNFIRRIENIADGVSTAYFYEDQAEPLLDVLTKIARRYNLDKADTTTAFKTQGARKTTMIRYNLGGSVATDFNFDLVLRGTGGIIHAKLVLPYDETKYDPSIIEMSKSCKEDQINTIGPYGPYPAALNILYILVNMRQCSNVLCPRAADYEESWKQCSKCCRVLYCSAECQRTDWNNEEKPHKRTCKVLKALGEVAGFPRSATGAPPPRMDPDQFEFRCMAADGEETQLVKAKKMCQYLMHDDRILKPLNNEYSKHYDYRLS